MKFKETKITLNDMKVGEPQTFYFTIINEGAPDNFALDPCCGSCTTVFPSKTSVEQGEELLVKAVFTPSSSGNLNKCIKLMQNKKIESKLWFQTKVEI